MFRRVKPTIEKGDPTRRCRDLSRTIDIPHLVNDKKKIAFVDRFYFFFYICFIYLLPFVVFLRGQSHAVQVPSSFEQERRPKSLA